MTYVKKRKTWEYRWYDQNGKVRSQQIPDVRTKRDAKKVQSAWDVEQADRNHQPEKTVWTLADAHEQVKSSRNYSPNYLNNLQTFWGRKEVETDSKGVFRKNKGKVSILDHFGEETLLSEIKVADVLRWVKVLKKQKTKKKDLDGTEKDVRVKDSTIKHYVNALSRALTLGMAYGVVDSNPCKHPEVQKQLIDDTSTRERVVSPDEVGRLLKHATKNVKTFLILAWATGGRMSEILTLEWKDLLFDKNEIRFEHDPAREKWVKSKKTATVSVHPEILRYVRDHHKRIDE
ncbi:MAG: tyrosine-type recombinase/integrase, partial [Candidatus Omnitrophica bacterium]|nr:tyrosine-type recombinase/integrase [Candidatus Omnitrophota bacterium]